MEIGAYISVITLIVNELNAAAKRQSGWMETKTRPIYMLSTRNFRPKDTYRLKVRGWKNIFYANGKQKKAGVASLISDKIDIKEDYKR